MKILVLAQYYPPDLGGSPTRAYNVARGLASKPHLLCFNVVLMDMFQISNVSGLAVALVPAFNEERYVASALGRLM